MASPSKRSAKCQRPSCLKEHMRQADICLLTDEESYVRTVRRIEQVVAAERGELVADDEA